MTIEELKKWKDDAERMLSTYKNSGHDMNDTVIGISASNFLDIVETCLEQKTGEYECDHAVVKAYNDGQAYILDKIRAEIENDWQFKKYPRSPWSCGLRRAIEIIDKYRGGDTDEEK